MRLNGLGRVPKDESSRLSDKIGKGSGERVLDSSDHVRDVRVAGLGLTKYGLLEDEDCKDEDEVEGLLNVPNEAKLVLVDGVLISLK